MKLMYTSIFLVSLIGCSNNQKLNVNDSNAPAWVHGEDVKYPSDAYWLGVGAGKTRTDASRNARGELANRIEARVTTSETSQSTEGTGADNYSSYSKSVSLESSAVFNGTRIAEWYQDPSSKEHYALAVLRKGEFLAEVQQKINKIDDALEDLPKTLMNSFRAEELLREREFWEKHYSAVSGGARMENPWEMNVDQVVNRRNEVLQKHPFKLTGDDIPQEFQEMLQELGLVFDPSSQNELKVNVKTSKYPSSENITRQKINIKLDAITPKSKSTVVLSEIGVGHSAEQSVDDGFKKMKEKQFPKLFNIVKAFGEVRL